MKIATFNVNSIRKRMPIVLDWLKINKPDVLCLQETKVVDADFPVSPLTEAGYHVTFRGMKGYNGVATLTLKKPESVKYGFCEGPDSEDFRLLLTVVEGLPVVNTYIPQGYLIDSPKYQYKLGWYERLRRYFDTELDLEKPAVWLGDMNVAPEPIDVHDPEKHDDHVCYHIDAKAAYNKTAQGRFVDVFRQKYPTRVQYTFWDFMQNSFARDKGWRIDHIMATPALAARLKEVDVDTAPRKAPSPSDHTVLWAEFH